MEMAGKRADELVSGQAAGRGRNPRPMPTIAASPIRFDPELGGTGGLKLPSEAAKFAREQSTKVRALGAMPPREMPPWLAELSERQLRPDRLVAEIFRRTLEKPNETTILEAHALLTELARDPKTAALINARLTSAVSRRLNRPQGEKRT
jgi:hypothetical protein